MAYYEIILLLSIVSPVPVLWTGSRERNLLWWYAWVCLLCDVVGYLAHRKQCATCVSVNVNLFLLLEFLFIAPYLLSTATELVQYKKAGKLIIAAIACSFTAHTLLLSPVESNYVDGAILYGCYIILCIFALYKVLQDIEQVKIERSPLFVFSAGFLLYASGSLIMLLFKIKLTVANRELMAHIWDARNVLNILKNLAIAYVFTLSKTKGSVAQ